VYVPDSVRVRERVQVSFGSRVRQLRLAAELTQEDLAHRCGLFRTYMSRIETGAANPTLTMIHALAGSLWVIALTGALALPIGVGAAIYLEEYGGRSRVARLVELNIANLAAVPSIIFGLLGLAVFVRYMAMGWSCRSSFCPHARRFAPSRSRFEKPRMHSARRNGRRCGIRCCRWRSQAS
jgi:transcriptional regulator with XRE-family HTH domain